jgi:endoglycosylceramidase
MFKFHYFLLIVLCGLLYACKKENQNQTSILLHAKKGANPGIYDPYGRFIILRGANYNSLGDYWQANQAVATQKQYEENDIKLMSKYGFNCIRLLFNWSKLEPQKGIYNQAYINEIKQVIEVAAKYNIYVLLDLHQDAYSKFIYSTPDENCPNPLNGWDGAPQWAVITDGQPTCMAGSIGVGGRESSRAVVHAWQNFWDNKNGIQDACINAWVALVKQTAKYSNVVGYDLLNEPSLGYQALNQQVDKLGRFYNQLIQKIRVAERESKGFNHIAFFEMSVTWNGEAIPFIPFPNFTNDDNIVFAPHTYFESISYLLTVEQGYDLISTLSKLYQTKMFVGEYGFFGNPTTDVLKLKRFAKKEDDNFDGSTWWQWAQAPGDPHAINWDGTLYSNTSMHLIELDKNGNFTGNINEPFLQVLGRTRPNAISGKPLKLLSNSDDGTMHLEAKSESTGTTTLWIPSRFGEPKITGNNIISVEVKKVDGGYIADVKIKNSYSIDVGY